MNIDDLTYTEKPDLRAATALMIEVFGSEDGLFIRDSLRHRPDRDLIREGAFVAPEGKVVAYTALCPETLVVDGVTLQVGKIEWVATAKPYRNKGLFGRIHKQLLAHAHKQGYPLSIIYGIPSFYRRYGYDFTVPCEWISEMDADRALSLPHPKGIRVRRAHPEDARRIYELGRRHVERRGQIIFANSLARIRARLRYESSLQLKTHVLLRGDRIEGYFMTQRTHGRVLLVDAVDVTAGTLPAALRLAARMVKKSDQSQILIRFPGPDPLLDAAKYWGATEEMPTYRYALQTRILDLNGLIRKMKPALNRRLSNSPFTDVDCTLPIRVSEESVVLEIRKGRVARIYSDPKIPMRDCLRMGRETMDKLLFGSAEFMRLLDEQPDLRCPHRLEPVARTLFPKLVPYVNWIDGL